MKCFSKILLLAAVLIVAVSCSLTSVETGDVKEVTVPVAVKEEPVKVEEPASVVWQKQVGDEAVVFTAYEDVVYVAVPSFVTLDEVNSLLAAVSEDFGAALKGVEVVVSDVADADYEIKGLTLESATVAMQILDMYFDHYVAIASGVEDVEDTKVSFAEDGALVYTIEVNGQELGFKFYKGIAYITYPETVSVESLLAAREALLSSYGSYLEGTTVEYVEDGLLAVTYPESVTYSEVVAFLDATKADVSTLAAFIPAPVVEEPTVVEVVAEAVKSAAETVTTTVQKTAEKVATTTTAVVEKAKEAVSSIELPQETEAKKSGAGTVILIIIIVLLVAACAYYFLVYKKKK